MARNRRTARGRGRSAQPAPRSPSLAPALVGLGLLLGVFITLAANLPGAIITWALVTTGAFLHPATELTGRKDKNGYATAAHAGEAKALRRYRFWSDMKWRMFSPNPDWWVGWPVYASTVLAIAVAAVAFHFDNLLAPASAVFAYVTVMQVSASRRRNSALGEPCPGTRFGSVKKLPDQLIGYLWRGALGLTAGVAAGFALSYLPFMSDLRSDVAGLVLLGLLGAVTAILPHWSNIALEHWRVVVAAREEWAPRWEMLKQDPVPTLVDRQEIGSLIVDLFDAPGSQGALAFYSMAPRIVPTIGTNTQVFILPSENLDQDGQPIPLSQHPLRFRIVTTTSDGMPDITDPNTDPAVVKAAIEIAVVGGCIEMGAAAPFIGDVALVSGHPEEPEPDEAEDLDDEAEFEERLRRLPPELADELRREREEALAESARAQSKLESAGPPPTPPAAWMVEVLTPNGPPLKWMHEDLEGAVAGSLGVEATFDYRNYGRLFIGALSDNSFIDINQQVQPLRDTSGVDEALHRVSVEDEWIERWRNALKVTVNFPVVEHSTYAEHALRDGTVIHSQSFVTLRGDDVVGTYFGLESKLATSLEHMPFVATTGFQVRSQRRGERHPQAFTVLWSEGPIPPNPDKLPPPAGAGNQSFDAQLAVLKGRVNEAFKAARLAQPEVYDVEPMTAPRSRGHIWKMKVRLYGGVTFADVRGAQQRIKQAWGSDWLRVTETPSGDGVIIVAGANPARITPRDETVMPELTSLDWEQAWLDANVRGVGGLTPQLKKVDHLPANEKVQVLDFTLPSGLSLEEVRQAKKKLMASTANAFVDMRPHPDNNPANIQMLACVENPMPYPVSYDFAYTDTLDKIIPFATGIEGRPIEVDVKESPHLLMLGLSGSGKANPVSCSVPVPMSERFPTGWAMNKDLRVGDQIFAVDGSLTTVTGFSRIVTEPVYKVTFSDGQVVEAGADHLWKVSDTVSRIMETEAFTSVREERLNIGERHHERLTVLADEIGSGTVASLVDIAKLAGYERDVALYQKLDRYNIDHLAVFAQKPSKKKSRLVEVEPIAVKLREKIDKRGQWIPFANNRIEDVHVDDLLRSAKANDGYLTARAMTDALLGRESNRAERDAMKKLIRQVRPSTKDGFTTLTCRLFPVDEILRLLAEHERAKAQRKTEHAPLMTLKTTAELKAMLESENKGRSPGVQVPGAIQLPEADLPVPPYTLGAWLGDGLRHHAAVSSADLGIVENIVADGYLVGRTDPCSEKALTYHFNGLKSDVKELFGTPLSKPIPEKYIPALYLRASYEQRLAVLQGLMDTEGSIDKRGACELTLSDKRLAADALELIRSLGIKASCSWDRPAAYRDTDGEPVECKDRHRIHFTTTTPVFRLARKAERLPKDTRGTQDWNYIKSIEVGEEAQLRCIKVDHPDHLFLVEGFIPTHNSVSAQNLMYGALVQGFQVAVIDIQKQGADFKFAEDRCIAFARDVPEAAATMEAVYDEVKRRAKISGQLGVGHVREWDDPPPPIIVFIDEFKGVLMAGKKPSTKAEENPDLEKARLEAMRAYEQKKRIGFLTGRLAAEARSADVHLFLMTQKLVASDLDDEIKDLRTNLARILLGKASNGDRMSALRDPFNAPDLGEYIPKGRGLWESVESTAEAIQFWYSPTSEYRENLVQRVPEVTDAERIDLSKYILPDLEDEQVAFEVISRSGPTSVQDEDITLDDLDLDLDDLLVEDETDDEPVTNLSALGIEIIADDEPLEHDGSTMSDGADDWLTLDGDEPDVNDALSWEDDEPVAQPLSDDEIFADLFGTGGGDDHEPESEPEHRPEASFTEPPPEPIGVAPAGLSGSVGLSDLVDMAADSDDSMFGWAVADALMEALEANPDIDTVTTDDPVMVESFDESMTRGELLASVAESFGVEFKVLDTPEEPEPVIVPVTVDYSNTVDDF